MNMKTTKKALRESIKQISTFINNNPAIVSITFKADRKRRKSDTVNKRKQNIHTVKS